MKPAFSSAFPSDKPPAEGGFPPAAPDAPSPSSLTLDPVLADSAGVGSCVPGEEYTASDVRLRAKEGGGFEVLSIGSVTPAGGAEGLEDVLPSSPEDEEAAAAEEQAIGYRRPKAFNKPVPKLSAKDLQS